MSDVEYDEDDINNDDIYEDQEEIEHILRKWQESEQYEAASPLERPLKPEITRKSHYIQLIITAFVFILIVINLAVLFKKYNAKKLKAKPKVDMDEKLKPPLIFNNKDVDTMGEPRNEKGFLTIGIPTVQREDSSYLSQTLDSLIDNTSAEDKEDVTVVIFLADFDVNVKEEVKKALKATYSQHLSSGFFRIIEVEKSFYPEMKKSEATFDDTMDRVNWRSKQVVDYAFMFMYSVNISEYYLHLEDDILSSSDFVMSIKEFIASQHSKWVSLEFSRLGFIGKLYRSEDLHHLAQFLLLFHMEQPVDFLYQYFNVLKAQPKVLTRTPSLFQHIGVQSSLKDKTQNLKDLYYDDSPKVHHGFNPSASIHTDIEAFQSFHPELAYNLSPGYFWGISPQSGSSFTVLFEESQPLTKVVIETGSKAHENDFLRNGKVEVSEHVVASKGSKPYCIDYVYLGMFTDGRFHVDTVQNHAPFSVRCIRLTVTQDQTAWLVIREIAVFI